MTLIAYRGRCPTCGRDDGHDPFATPAAQPATDDDAAMTPFDRCEFALRDAGFDYDEAFRIAHLAHPSQPSAPDGGEQLPPHGRSLELAMLVLLDQANRMEMFGANGTAANIREAHADIAHAIQCRSARMDELRTAIADYMYSEGCSCCRNNEAHAINKKRIAELLDVPAQPDGCDDVWFDFSPYRTPG